MSGTKLHSLSHRLLICALAGLFIAAVAPKSFSGTPDESVRSIKVKFGELDLSKAAGAAELYRRIRIAAHNVCGYDNDPVYRWASRGYATCVKTAVAKAVDQVNSPILTAMHRAKSAGKDLS